MPEILVSPITCKMKINESSKIKIIKGLLDNFLIFKFLIDSISFTEILPILELLEKEQKPYEIILKNLPDFNNKDMSRLAGYSYLRNIFLYSKLNEISKTEKFIKQISPFGFNVKIIIGLEKENIAHLINFFEICDNYFLEGIVIEIKPDDTNKAELLEKIRQYYDQGFKIEFSGCVFPCLLRNMTNNGCDFGKAGCYIDEDGEVFKCEFSSLGLGNLNCLKIEEIWKEKSPSNCNCTKCICFKRFRCRGICPEVDKYSPDYKVEETSETSICLQKEFKIKNYFNLHERFGQIILVNGDNYFVLPESDKRYFELINNNSPNLQLLYEEYGAEALSLIGKLYLENLIGFEKR